MHPNPVMIRRHYRILFKTDEKFAASTMFLIRVRLSFRGLTQREHEGRLSPICRQLTEKSPAYTSFLRHFLVCTKRNTAMRDFFLPH